MAVVPLPGPRATPAPTASGQNGGGAPRYKRMIIPDCWAPIFQLRPAEAKRAATLFAQMHEELASDYAHKYDLLRAYVLELLHLG
ncbi:hypothetical protein [Hymenobacter sp. YC55]|uniref:hypothetical protein n=1 Tax=Hymenobacter sp. YC55 TaxID=3034019 RepID=UPI0023F7612D|nr:hypothetical protein [Hymenobacter sp. YC55]MDF7814101.1 hypothetical protein [Hymenobacter sp. YC55]